MADDCPLCMIPDTKPAQLVEKGKYVYAAIPYAPIEPGHVMIVPYRHVRLKNLTPLELVELRDMTCFLEDKLVRLYPNNQPIDASMLGTKHASIPDHYHAHLIPSPANMNYLLAAYYGRSPERVILPESELEIMAQRLR